MFPPARNAHRRPNNNNSNEAKKIPIPIAVTLHNLMAEGAPNAKLKSEAASKWFRPDHDWSLVPKVVLEIVVEGSRVVYSGETEIQSVHPSWEHIDERIDLPGEWWLSEGDLYKTMKLRFTIHNSNANFLEVPLYPSKLERLNGSPEALPPNACFVYFSDGSTRLPLNVFQILLDSQMAEAPPIEDFSRFEDDAFSVLDTVPQEKVGNRPRAVSASSLLGEGTFLPQVQQQTKLAEPTTPEIPESMFQETEQDAMFQDFETEREFLLAMIAKEEAAMQREVLDLQEDKKSLETLLQQAKTLEEDIRLVRTETKKQEIQLHRDRFLIDAQRVKLLKELRTVYPLTLHPQKGYLIRELRLPVDIYTTNVPEDEMSAALGYACHLVFMVSKYLSVPLRYRIYCNSSRSVIQHDGILFPLFLARHVEREQLERGLALLGADVDCILMTYEVGFTPKSHIVARLKRLFDHIVEGDEKENGIK